MTLPIRRTPIGYIWVIVANHQAMSDRCQKDRNWEDIIMNKKLTLHGLIYFYYERNE